MSTNHDIAFMSAAALAAAYRSKALSPVEATRAILARIDRLNPSINAYCHVAHESAMTEALASEARWAQGSPLSPIDGVPTGIKDLILTKGMPTLRGSKTVDQSQSWADDAPAAARLKEAGAVLLGKTCTPEWGWKGVTDSPVTGITRNPWNPSVTPGGSSGGASAALAAGVGPVQGVPEELELVTTVVLCLMTPALRQCRRGQVHCSEVPDLPWQTLLPSSEVCGARGTLDARLLGKLADRSLTH